MAKHYRSRDKIPVIFTSFENLLVYKVNWLQTGGYDIKKMTGFQAKQ